MFEHSKKTLDSAIEKSNELDLVQISNPLFIKDINSKNALNNYEQALPRLKYDSDASNILEVVRILNNLAPIRMPEYNFNINEINGEHYYKPDGSLLLIREWDSDVVRDYYPSNNSEEPNFSIARILEHDKISGRLKTKIEPVIRHNCYLRTNVTIFDLKINNKYILIQLSEGGFVNNISEFTGKGKSFQTLFRNLKTLKPVRYLEGKDNPEKGFEMVDCIFDEDGNIVRIKRYSNKSEININYTQNSKNITVNKKV